MHWLSKKSTKIIMIMPAVILFTVFFLAPIFISVYYSFTDFSGIGAAKFIGFKNYQVLLKDKFFFIALKNTFIILIGITITILPLSFIVALLLEKPFRGSGVVQSMIFAPNVIAPILVGLIWLFILDPKMGMINAILRSIGLSDYQQQWIGGKTLTPYSVAFVYLWQAWVFLLQCSTGSGQCRCKIYQYRSTRRRLAQEKAPAHSTGLWQPPGAYIVPGVGQYYNKNFIRKQRTYNDAEQTE